MAILVRIIQTGEAELMNSASFFFCLWQTVLRISWAG